MLTEHHHRIQVPHPGPASTTLRAREQREVSWLQRRLRADPIAAGLEIHLAERKDDDGGGIVIHRRRRSLAPREPFSAWAQVAEVRPASRVLAMCWR